MIVIAPLLLFLVIVDEPSNSDAGDPLSQRGQDPGLAKI